MKQLSNGSALQPAMRKPPFYKHLEEKGMERSQLSHRQELPKEYFVMEKKNGGLYRARYNTDW